MSEPTGGPVGSGATEPGGRRPSVDDTAAFQRFYFADPAPPPAAPAAARPSLFHRLFVGWWRDRGS